MRIVGVSLIHLLREIPGMFDQRMLTSMNDAKTTNQGFSFSAKDQSNFFWESIHKARHMSMIVNVRSSGLDSGVVAEYFIHCANGLLDT